MPTCATALCTCPSQRAERLQPRCNDELAHTPNARSMLGHEVCLGAKTQGRRPRLPCPAKTATRLPRRSRRGGTLIPFVAFGRIDIDPLQEHGQVNGRDLAVAVAGVEGW